MERTNFVQEIDQISQKFERVGVSHPYKGHEPQISLGVNKSKQGGSEQYKLVKFVEDLETNHNIQSPYYADWQGWNNFRGGVTEMGDLIEYRMHKADKIRFNLEDLDLSKQVREISKRNKEVNRLKLATNKLHQFDQIEGLITRWELNNVLSDASFLNKTQFYETAATTISRDEVWARLYAPTFAKIFSFFK